MRSSFMGLEVQLRSLQVAQKHLDVTGHNLGNMKTPGFTRQRVDVHSLHLSGNNHWFTNLTRLSLAGQGVSAFGVSQIRNEYLDRRFRDMVPEAVMHNTKNRLLSELETALDKIDSFSLLDAMNEFKSVLERVALDRPDAREMSSIVRNQAVNIARMLRTHYEDLNRLMDNNLWELENSINGANNIIERIVAYNRAITREYVLDAGRIIRGQGVSEYGPLEMLDNRNLLLDELAQFGNIEVFQNNNGSVRVTMGGVTVIDDQDFLQIRMQEFSNFNAAVLSFSNGEDFMPRSGEIRAFMEMLNGNGPYASGAHQTSTFGIPYYINALNAFAAGFADALNDAMNASLRASGFFEAIDPVTGEPLHLRADNSNWVRNLIWGGYEYYLDGDRAGERRTQMVQARDEAGRLMTHAAGETGWVIRSGPVLPGDTVSRCGRWVQATMTGGEPVMIESYMRAAVNAGNIQVSPEWMDEELLIGMTFDPNAGAWIRARDANGQPAYTQGQAQTQAVGQGTQQAMRQARASNGNVLWHQRPQTDDTGNPTGALNNNGDLIMEFYDPATGETVPLIERVPVMEYVYVEVDGVPTSEPVMVPAFERDSNGQYIDANGRPLGRFANGNLVNPGARVPITGDGSGASLASTTSATFVDGPPLWQRNESGHYILSDGRLATANEVDPSHEDYIPGITDYLVPLMQNRYHPNGDPVMLWSDGAGGYIADDDPGFDPAIHTEPYMVEHYVRTGAWRPADLDGTNLQRFIRELEADRTWGNVNDFNGCAFGKLQFMSTRLAQGIEHTSREFEITMATVNVILDQRDAVSGVCETEEGINMLKYQRWFNASARLMTTLDEALDVIINRMGRVGL